MERLARRLGVKPQLDRLDWEALIPSLESRRIDLVLNGLEVTEERGKQVALTTPYFQFVQQATVRTADAGKYPTIESLHGRKIAVLNGSASIAALKNRGWTDDLIMQFDDSLKPFDALKAGRVDGVVGESIIAQYYADGDDDLTNLPGEFSPGLYAAAVRPEDRDLLEEINRQLTDMKTSGELGELYQRWGIWNKRQETIGIVPGTPQREMPLHDQCG